MPYCLRRAPHRRYAAAGTPAGVRRIARVTDRGYRCAKPPANGFEPSGFDVGRATDSPKSWLVRLRGRLALAASAASRLASRSIGYLGGFASAIPEGCQLLAGG
jgi:hypothetical protein